MTGKGDTPRPLSVPKATFDANWSEVFAKDFPEMLKLHDANWAEVFPPAVDEMTGYDTTGHYCPSDADLPKPAPRETLGDPEE